MILGSWFTVYKGTATPSKQTEKEKFPQCFSSFSLLMFMCYFQAEGKTQQISFIPSAASKIPPSPPEKGVWVAQFVKYLTSDFGSGLGLGVMRLSPALGSPLGVELA